ncbi:elongation factor G [Tuwongella immobilis]|uniref:Elongation factor G n=1 Tax=Tuwongella immobilis TaxID=692036 RepID=A0A6C2YQN6_9BACT|nr:elongation factor G [Tuwongella immobilis]VIP03315.1 translation elongation factor g : Elongation factor G OS=Flexistipes sinusarabici (strain DSM 4947 / MAS 10) GN=fusA PE=3 SV=1: GTP_EFTU: GTP_EFTU_D2: EFG_II: EFG_IV: EFG_C [Tuwongella immobilis]VTS04001.1 translation elongation factor g : Elongation factor G OS=Flexistipes sinusarabici (strain DSM 4947 / MAS 10) GN=fusA PE=3 SV=1: GTP_EFTU: GTP_EFTU_D2: EFG_II: EFG_IV: EFG_C [Tuwongella immobilis]
MLDKLRNIGIIAHVDAGKTTTTERILYFSGTKHKIGDVDSGDTTTDYDPLEKAKGITINSAAVSIDWGDNEINIIDTPGHVDFTAEVERSLRVLDGAVGVFCAVGGVEVQSETVWYQANKYKVPRLAYVNKLDRLGADFFACVDEIKTKLGATPCICTIPYGQDSAFKGIIDLIRMKYVLKDPTDKAHVRYSFVDIPEEMVEQAEEYRAKLLDMASLASDELAEALIEGTPVSEQQLRTALRKGTIDGIFTPIHCGSSKNYQGVQLLLDAVIDYLPSPIDRPPVEGTTPKGKEKATRKPLKEEPFSGLAFKTIAEPTGDLVFVRVYSGEMKPGDTVMNTTSGKTERISRIYRMMGNKKVEMEVAGPGEIVAVTGLKQTFTGNTLCDTSNQVVLESIRFPEPVIAMAITPTKTTDETKFADALGRLLRDDPTLKAFTDPETNQHILSGMGELHLEVTVEKLHRFPGVQVTVGRPMVAYRQTIANKVELQTRYIKQSGGRGKFAVITMVYEPLSPEQIEEIHAKLAEAGEKPDPNNIYFEETIVGGVVPREYIPSVEAGFREGTVKGAKYQFPVVGIKGTLTDGKYHDVDSSQDAFRLAGWENFRDAQVQAGIVLLEPIMKVVVVAPEAYMGSLTGDISRRRGEILETAMDRGRCSISAYVPLASLVGYTTELRGATSGTASFSMEPSHYAPVKEELADLPKKDSK